jgi:hypothetical protein
LQASIVGHRIVADRIAPSVFDALADLTLRTPPATLDKELGTVLCSKLADDDHFQWMSTLWHKPTWLEELHVVWSHAFNEKLG